MAGGYPVLNVHGVVAAVDFDEVVDCCGFGSFAPMAGRVVLKEFGAGFSIGRGVEVFASVVSHGRVRRLCSPGRRMAGPRSLQRSRLVLNSIHRVLVHYLTHYVSLYPYLISVLL